MTVQASDPTLRRRAGGLGRAQSAVDGVPAASATPARTGRRVERPNRFLRRASWQRQPRAVESSDGLMAICTAHDDQVSWLQAGQTLSALWLQATRAGLSIVPLSQVIEVPETRRGACTTTCSPAWPIRSCCSASGGRRSPAPRFRAHRAARWTTSSCADRWCLPSSQVVRRSCRGSSAVGDGRVASRSLTSTSAHPELDTISGFTSSSATWGTSWASRARGHHDLDQCIDVDRLAPPEARRAAASTATPASARRTSLGRTGGNRYTRSRRMSVFTPPAPTITRGPTEGSRTTPTAISTAGDDGLHEDRHVRPAELALEGGRPPSTTASDEVRPTRTRPRSVRWTTSPSATLIDDREAHGLSERRRRDRLRARPRRPVAARSRRAGASRTRHRPSRRVRPRWPASRLRLHDAAGAVARSPGWAPATSASTSAVRSASQAAYLAARPSARTAATEERKTVRPRGSSEVASQSPGRRGARAATGAVPGPLPTPASPRRCRSGRSPRSRRGRRRPRRTRGRPRPRPPGPRRRRLHRRPRGWRFPRCPGRARRSSSGSAPRARGRRAHRPVAASAASTPIPPALLTMPRRGPAVQRLPGEQERGLGQVLGAVAGDHTGLGEEGGDTDGGSGGGRGVRGARAAAAVRPSADHGEQRLAFGEPAGDAGELRCVPEGLEVERRRRDAGVVGPRGEQVVAGHVDLVAERDQAADAEPELARQVGQHDAHPARLRGDGQTAVGRQHPGERGVELDLRVVAHHAQAVGSHHADAVGARQDARARAGAGRPRLRAPGTRS